MNFSSTFKCLTYILTFLLFSNSVFAWCGMGWTMRPRCMIPQRYGDGDLTWQTYCPAFENGQFSYCMPFSGDCCSDPVIGTGMTERCCSSTQIQKYVGAVSTPGLSRSAYKCCDIPSFGLYSRVYKDSSGTYHCCGGQTYYAKSSDASKTCCNPSFSALGAITQNRKVATVEGFPVGGIERLCCDMAGIKPGTRSQTAYWNGSGSYCCDGRIYDATATTKGCCANSRDVNDNITVARDMTTVLGAPAGQPQTTCCTRDKVSDPSRQAVWNGWGAECCNASSPNASKVTTGSGSYSGPEYKCCPSGQSAFASDGSSSICCKPDKAHKTEAGYYGCCSDSLFPRVVQRGNNGEEICCSEKEAFKRHGTTNACCDSNVRENLDGTLDCCSSEHTLCYTGECYPLDTWGTSTFFCCARNLVCFSSDNETCSPVTETYCAEYDEEWWDCIREESYTMYCCGRGNDLRHCSSR